MNKYERIRRICIVIGSLLVVCGAFMIATRGNPLEESIGYVGVTNGSQIIEVEGHKYSYNSEDKNSLIESFIPIEDADNIPEIDYFPNDENSSLSITYTEDYTGNPSYVVYDENFKKLIECNDKLEMPGESGKKYYIEASVDWGNKDKNVTVKYYFVINVK